MEVLLQEDALKGFCIQDCLYKFLHLYIRIISLQVICFQNALDLPQHIRSTGGLFQKSGCAYKASECCAETDSRLFFVFTAEEESLSVVWMKGEHSTGLTQDMLTSASFSQKPIKLIVGRIIQTTDRARGPIVNSGEEKKKNVELGT